jgi:hypothetical protein
VVCADVDDAAGDAEAVAPPFAGADRDAPVHPLTAGSRVATMIAATKRCEELVISVRD